MQSWDGELYLELHRGTYTSQAWIKHANRRMELLFRQAERIGRLAWQEAAGRIPDLLAKPQEPLETHSQDHAVVMVFNSAPYRRTNLFTLVSSLVPDDTADPGVHEFLHALLPHAGDLPIAGWQECGLLERAESDGSRGSEEIRLDLAPFEIKTVLVQFTAGNRHVCDSSACGCESRMGR